MALPLDLRTRADRHIGRIAALAVRLASNDILTGMSEAELLKAEEERIKQLGKKSGQMLLFLSFALMVVATLKNKTSPIHLYSLRATMLWWSSALFPVVLGVLPLKEFRPESSKWYHCVRLFKVVLFWIAGALIIVGSCFFVWAVRETFPFC